MSNEDIRRHVCSVLTAIQADSGMETPSLTDDTSPLIDLPGFDSLATVDAEARLSEAMGVELDRVQFWSPTTGKEQTIGEIVAQLAKRYGEAGSGTSHKNKS